MNQLTTVCRDSRDVGNRVIDRYDVRDLIVLRVGCREIRRRCAQGVNGVVACDHRKDGEAKGE
jgi:hypothetical protein